MHNNLNSNSNNSPSIEIIEYNAAWPAQFLTEQAILQTVLSKWLVGDIEHIGSTAVPGLAAKPVIDIMAPVASLEGSRDAIAAAESAGYCYYPYKPNEMHWFCKPSPLVRTHHLHMVPQDSKTRVERLAFRDALRRNPALMNEYAALKRRLAVEFANDRDAYTDAKAPFIQNAIRMQTSHKT
jgi:GrpB-like predicted nucleotidyltransferase (UPF0157 family)